MKDIPLPNDTAFHKQVLAINALLPVLLTVWDFNRNQLGANPVEFVTRASGVMALLFLVLTLLVTPLRRCFGLNMLLKLRRDLGLYSFYYAVAHFMTYAVFDRGLQLSSIAADTWRRPFIAVGMMAFLLMIPLAVTSTNAMIQRLGGKRWALLHRLTYLILVGGVVHYSMIVKSDLRWPLWFGFISLVLLGYRVAEALNRRAKPKGA